MNVYSVDVNIVGTAYIKADSPEEALELANGMLDDGLEFSSRHQTIGDDICMDGRPYRCLADNDEDIAFSPAMSINASDNSFTLDDLDLAEEAIDLPDDEDVD